MVAVPSWQWVMCMRALEEDYECYPLALRPLKDWIDRQTNKLKTPPIGKQGRSGSPRSTGGKKRSSATASQRSSSASKVGSRSTSSLASKGSGEGQLAPAVQHLFAVTQSPKSGAGPLSSRGMTEPSTPMKHQQPKKDGGISLGASLPSHSLLHLLRQGSSAGHQQGALPTASHPPSGEVSHLLSTATSAYQAPVHGYSAQGIQCVNWSVFDHIATGNNNEGHFDHKEFVSCKMFFN